MEFLQDLDLEKIVLIVTTVVSACAMLAALTPSPKDDEFLAKARKLVDLVGMNFGHAKNADKDVE